MKILDFTPPLYASSTTLNKLGLQRLRIFFLNFGRRTPKPVRSELQPIVDAIAKDGTVILRNFFPPEVFAEIREEYEAAFTRWQQSRTHNLESSGWDPKHFEKIEEFVEAYDSPVASKYLRNNQSFIEIVEAITHRKVRIMPLPVFWTLGLKAGSEVLPETKYHNTQFLHSDVVFPTVKIWIYLNDISKDNAAFTFAKGSHFPSKDWIERECRMSHHPEKHGCITDEEARERGFEEHHMEGPANTVVISNHMGYHRRGEFQKLERRETIHLDFRYVESFRNRFDTLIRFVKSIVK